MITIRRPNTLVLIFAIFAAIFCIVGVQSVAVKKTDATCQNSNPFRLLGRCLNEGLTTGSSKVTTDFNYPLNERFKYTELVGTVPSYNWAMPPVEKESTTDFIYANKFVNLLKDYVQTPNVDCRDTGYLSDESNACFDRRRNAIGAAIYILIILGQPSSVLADFGNTQYAETSPGVPAANYDEYESRFMKAVNTAASTVTINNFRARILDYDRAGLINWNTTVTFTDQHINSGVMNHATDMFIGQTNSTNTNAIVMKGQDGNLLMVINRRCGNLTKYINPLPPIDPPPEGVLTKADCNTIEGYAHDWDTSLPIKIELFIGGKKGIGTKVNNPQSNDGTWTASKHSNGSRGSYNYNAKHWPDPPGNPRIPPQNYGDPPKNYGALGGLHGFKIDPTPNDFLTGVNQTVYVYALGYNSSGLPDSTYALISLSPRTINGCGQFQANCTITGITPTNPAVPGLPANNVVANQQFTVSANVRNMGSGTWANGQVVGVFGGLPSNFWSGSPPGNPANFGGSVAPGGNRNFTFTATAQNLVSNKALVLGIRIAATNTLLSPCTLPVKIIGRFAITASASINVNAGGTWENPTTGFIHGGSITYTAIPGTPNKPGLVGGTATWSRASPVAGATLSSRLVGWGSQQSISNPPPFFTPIATTPSYAFATGDSVCATLSAGLQVSGFVIAGSGYIDASGVISNPGPASTATPDCEAVVNRPYLRISGNDVSAGMKSGTAANCPGWDVDNPNGSIYGYGKDDTSPTAGSANQLALLALGPIRGFRSAALRNVPGTESQPPRGLTFANRPPVPGDVGYGGRLATNHCPLDYAGAITTATSAAPASLDVSTLASGTYNYTGDITNLYTSIPLPAGKHVVIRVSGLVVIPASITYNLAGWTTAAYVPSLTVITNTGILIGPAVTQLDGTYIAQGASGTIDTCGFVTANNIYTVCNNQLKVNGSLIAKTIKWRRTYGSVRNSQGGTEYPGGSLTTCANRKPASPINNYTCASEAVDFSPESYIVPAAPDSYTSGTPKYDFFTVLPPLL